MGEEKVDRPIRELVGPGQALVVISTLSVGEVVAHALHRVEVDARAAVLVLRYGGQLGSDRPGGGMRLRVPANLLDLGGYRRHWLLLSPFHDAVDHAPCTARPVLQNGVDDTRRRYSIFAAMCATCGCAESYPSAAAAASKHR